MGDCEQGWEGNALYRRPNQLYGELLQGHMAALPVNPQFNAHENLRCNVANVEKAPITKKVTYICSIE